jgi:hypothetical protein
LGLGLIEILINIFKLCINIFLEMFLLKNDFFTVANASDNDFKVLANMYRFAVVGNSIVVGFSNVPIAAWDKGMSFKIMAVSEVKEMPFNSNLIVCHSLSNELPQLMDKFTTLIVGSVKTEDNDGDSETVICGFTNSTVGGDFNAVTEDYDNVWLIDTTSGKQIGTLK